MRRALPALMVIGLTISLISVPLTTKRKSNFSGAYLFGDPGVTMLATQEILAGRMLYRDVAMPYGPVPVYAYAGLARLFGNHIGTYLTFHAIFTLIFVNLTYASLGRFYSPHVAATGLLFLLIPLTATPGGLAGAIANSPYTTPEKCLLAGLTLIWSNPIRRTIGRGLAIGALLGFWQYFKFGGGVFAGGAVLLVDLLVLIASKSDRPVWSRWFLAGIGTMIAALAFEAVRDAIAFAVLPASIAWDVVWPSYTKALYNTIRGDARYPHWIGLRHFVVQLLPPIIGCVATMIAAWWIVRDCRAIPHVDGRRRDEPAMLIPGFFFLLGNLGYFGHLFIYMQYAWCLVWAIPLLLSRIRWAGRVLLLAGCVPLFLVTLRSPMRTEVTPNTIATPLPTGDVVYLSPEDHEMLVAARRGLDLARSKDGGSVLVYPTGAGFDWAFAVHRYSRDTWHLPHYIRPYDEPALVAGADRLTGLILLHATASDDESLEGSTIDRLCTDGVFSSEVVDAMKKRLPNRVPLSARCVIFLP